MPLCENIIDNFQGTSVSVVAESTGEGGIGKERTEKRSEKCCENLLGVRKKMGYGQEEIKKRQANVEIVERGEIFFFYRPKVEREEAQKPDDVQRLYIVLRPESGERAVVDKQDTDSGKEGAKLGAEVDDDKPTRIGDKADEGGHDVEKIDICKRPLLRFIVLGKKSLPDTRQKRGRPYWGFVDLVTTRMEVIKAALKGEEYDTATRGQRLKEPARALAEGVYRILRHNPQKECIHIWCTSLNIHQRM